MSYTFKQYQEWYTALEDPHQSREANKKLIELQNSQSAWGVARQLMATHNSHYFDHGCQILSKRLNKAYSEAMESSLNNLGFIYSLQHLNPILYMCIAKIHLHLDLQQIRMEEPYRTPETLIRILAMFPDAMKSISVGVMTKHSQQGRELIKSNRQQERTKYYLKKYKHVLEQHFEQYPNIIINCIDNYVLSSIRIESAEIVKLLLARDITDVSSILENVLLTEKYPELNQQIYQYLLRSGLQDITVIETSQLEQIWLVFLSFCRGLQLLQLGEPLLLEILAKIIQIMRSELSKDQETDETVLTIENSFEFWSELCAKLHQNQTSSASQIEICRQSLLEVWRIVIHKSILPQLPSFTRQSSDPLVISLDDDLDDIPLKITASIEPQHRFRPTAEDFILLIYNCLCDHEMYKQELLRSIYDLAGTTNPVQLELAIFVIKSMVENTKSGGIQELGMIIQRIVRNENAKIPYIWQELLRLLSHFGIEITSNVKVLCLSLMVLHESLRIPELQSLAAETCCSILFSCQQSAHKEQLALKFEEFINTIFEPLYLDKSIPVNVFESLTKAIFIFIYCFKKSPQHFKRYLAALPPKINSLPSQVEQVRVLSCLAAAHNYISSQYALQFAPVLSQFLSSYLPIFIQNIQSNYKINKETHKVLIMEFSIILLAVGGYNTNSWADAVRRLIEFSCLENIATKHPSFHYIRLMNVLLCIENHEGAKYSQAVIKLIQLTHAFITDRLENTVSNDYELIAKYLTFHLQVLKKYVSHIEGYSPQPVLKFIATRILADKQIWEYELLRISLQILIMLATRNYQVETILDIVMASFARVVECFWKSLETLLASIYQQGGIQVFCRVFALRCPKLSPPSPLFNVFHQAMAASEWKTVKNLLSDLD